MSSGKSRICKDGMADSPYFSVVCIILHALCVFNDAYARL